LVDDEPNRAWPTNQSTIANSKSSDTTSKSRIDILSLFVNDGLGQLARHNDTVPPTEPRTDMSARGVKNAGNTGIS